ncbi:hypothetical protein D3C72_778780 [compost metagenome]
MQLDPRRAQQGVGLQRDGFGHVHPHRQIRRNGAARLAEDDLRRIAMQAVFGCHGQQPSLPVRLAALGHGHGDADGGPVAALDPGVVGNGEDQPHRRRALQVVLQHAAGKGLGDRVGGDEAEAAQAGALGRQDIRRPVPPGRDQIGRAEPPLPHLPQGVDIAVAQLAPQVLAADEGRIADDEVDVRPRRRTRVDQADHLALVRGGVEQHRGVAVLAPWSGSGPGARDGPSHGVAHQFLARPRQQGVGLPDLLEVAQDRLGRLGVAKDPEMPLQIADPHHHLGDPGGVGVLFQPPELLRADRVSVQRQGALRLAHLGQDSEHLAFQLLHHAHGDIEEVAGPAGRVQHADTAQVAVKIPHHAARPPLIARHIEADGAGLDGLPVRTQGFHDRRLDQAFDIGARGVVGAQFRALVRGQGLFQQGPEDGRLHRGPVALSRRNQGLQFILGDRQGRSVAEQPPVEPAQGLANG